MENQRDCQRETTRSKGDNKDEAHRCQNISRKDTYSSSSFSVGSDGVDIDRFEAREPPGPHLAKPVGPVEPDPQALDPARREVERQHRAEGEETAALLGQHPVHVGFR